jgi:hypothetical protein
MPEGKGVLRFEQTLYVPENIAMLFSEEGSDIAAISENLAATGGNYRRPGRVYGWGGNLVHRWSPLWAWGKPTPVMRGFARVILPDAKEKYPRYPPHGIGRAE